MRRFYRPATPAERDARTERRIARLDALGTPRRDDTDRRSVIALDLRPMGGALLVLEPVRGKVAWRARNAETGKVVAQAAGKALLHALADDLPRMLAASNFE